MLYPDNRLAMMRAWKDPVDFAKLMRDAYEKRIAELEAENKALIEWGKPAFEFIDQRSGGWLVAEAPDSVRT